MLRPSTPDEISLSDAVQLRFLELCEEYLRIRGVGLVTPPSMDKEFVRWRTMAVRQRQGDFRCSNDEIKALRVVAQWTIDIKRQITNQPAKNLEWSDLPR